MTHGLPYLDWGNLSAVPGWSRDFDAWAAAALERGDVDELSRFRTSAPVRTVIDGFKMGLANRSFEAAG
jgi:hypothetical protein